MSGEPKTFTLPNGNIRKVDNLIGTTAREIKSGKLKRSSFIEKQIEKDLELLTDKKIPIKKIEWHLFDGADQNMLNTLKELRKTFGSDKFDFIIYRNIIK